MLLSFSNDETLKFEKFVLKVLRKFVCNFGPIFLGKKCGLSAVKYGRQVSFAGCRLKFHYNWKTTGTKKKGKAIDLP